MPFLFLSPSTQTFNAYITKENEQYWMNLLADAMEPYLLASGVNYTRNNPLGSAVQSIADSNAGQYDFHLALHSNAAGTGSAGTVRGIDIYYYPNSEKGLAMASILVDNLKPVYPLPNLVRALTSSILGELRRTDAPAVLCELGYHDNPSDALWIEDNLTAIARAIALSVTEYFGLPFLVPSEIRSATVSAEGSVKLRAYPDWQAESYKTIPNGSTVQIYGTYEPWYTAVYEDTVGFINKEYVVFDSQ